MKSTFISIIVPGYNEERRIQNTLIKLHAFCLTRFSCFEILFVDDGSIDKTRQVVKKLSYHRTNIRYLGYPKNKGKGFAIRFGLKYAKGTYIFFTDADLPYDPQFFCYAVNVFQKTACEIVSGNRHLKQSCNIAGASRKRQMASQVFSYIIKYWFGITTTDTQCGIKGFSKACAQQIIQKSRINGYAFDVEIFLLARQHHWQVETLPVILINDLLSKIRLRLDPIFMILDLLRIYRVAWD